MKDHNIWFSFWTQLTTTGNDGFPHRNGFNRIRSAFCFPWSESLSSDRLNSYVDWIFLTNFRHTLSRTSNEDVVSAALRTVQSMRWMNVQEAPKHTSACYRSLFSPLAMPKLEAVLGILCIDDKLTSKPTTWPKIARCITNEWILNCEREYLLRNFEAKNDTTKTKGAPSVNSIVHEPSS